MSGCEPENVRLSSTSTSPPPPSPGTMDAIQHIIWQGDWQGGLHDRLKGCLVGSVVASSFGRLFNTPFYRSHLPTLREVHERCADVAKDPCYVRCGFSGTVALVVLEVTVGCYTVERDYIADGLGKALGSSNYFGGSKHMERLLKEFHRRWNATSSESNSALRRDDEAYVCGPARSAHGGQGSHGYHGAVMAAAVALYYCREPSCFLRREVEKCVAITHAHRLGIDGAVLFAFGLQEACDSARTASVTTFLKRLEDYASTLEPPFGENMIAANALYVNHSVLRSPADIIRLYPNVSSRAAQDFVPLAMVMAFVGGNLQWWSGYNIMSPWKRMVQSCIALGGDTDGRTFMAGALYGAFYGLSSDQREFEAMPEITEANNASTLADALYKGCPPDD